MNLAQQKISVSGLLLAVSFLVLMPFFPMSTVSGTAVAPQSYSYSYSWNPSFTHSHGSGSWTWSGTWTSWSTSWSRTWSHHTHTYPTYTTTAYICDPNDPYSPCYSYPPCNPYDPLSPCYAPPAPVTTYYLPTQTTTVITEAQLQTTVTTQTISVPAQGPSFALSVSPSIVSLPAGDFVGSTDFTLNLTSVQGWTGAVYFTTSPLPPGITFSNLPSQFSLTSPAVSWDVQVNIGPPVQPGTYTILIVASSGTFAQSISLSVEAA